MKDLALDFHVKRGCFRSHGRCKDAVELSSMHSGFIFWMREAITPGESYACFGLLF